MALQKRNKKIRRKSIINVDGVIKELNMESTNEENIIKSATKIAEKMGGDFTDVIKWMPI